ncbi:MAG TPA: Shedu anti-phage system protein SduA domain-containing protein [Burkholderiaceae bacterium]|nr:Shedu anti-phage system protein SduA domain-containing protein [Burkholderiaceae bacterium]
MHVLLVARTPATELEQTWAKFGIGTTHIPFTRLLPILNSSAEREGLQADAIVLHIELLISSDSKLTDAFDSPAAADFIRKICELDPIVAMPDGRRWSALPIRVSWDKLDDAEARRRYPGSVTVRYADLHQYELPLEGDCGAGVLRSDVRKYRQAVLNELDNLGFIVTYKGGRYRLGPALKPRPELAGHYYFGPADRRGTRFVTIDRDLLGLQLEVELLEALLNREDASENEYQRFFEEHPHFLSILSTPMAHVQLREATGRLLIPDFVLKPIAAAQRDSRWEVLELKRPQVALVVGRGARRRLSHDVQCAIRQLRDYGDYFADPRNGEAIEQALGHRLRRPKLGVLIGRLVTADVNALEDEQSRLPDIRIITYDEILEQQRSVTR